MKAPEHFEIMEGYCCYRLSGHGRLSEAANKVIEVITFSREQGVRNLLIDTLNWTGHERPDTFERFTWAVAFAEAARSLVKVAMVVGSELMDPEKFDVTVAVNRGLLGDVVLSEQCALDALSVRCHSHSTRKIERQYFGIGSDGPYSIARFLDGVKEMTHMEILAEARREMIQVYDASHPVKGAGAARKRGSVDYIDALQRLEHYLMHGHLRPRTSKHEGELFLSVLKASHTRGEYSQSLQGIERQIEALAP